MNVVGRSAHQFHQSKMNEQKLGAYYTDPQHCRWLRNLFEFSTEDETAVLEPSAGNGVAVKLVTGVDKNPKIRNFAVEINADAVEQLKADGSFESVLKADFKSEVFITNNAFSFCFGNPPYMDELDFERSYGVKKERTEKVFLDKVTKYLRSGGIICWVIPHRVFVEDVYMSFWMSRFETLGVYKFHESEFKKWGQVAVIGRKRPCSIGVQKDDRKVMQERCRLDLLKLVPTSVEETQKIKVPTSSSAAVTNFRTIRFDPQAAEEFVRANPECQRQLNAAIASKTGIPVYSNAKTFAPPKKLSFANLALLTACGVGSGFAGSLAEKNLHLQRGSVETTIKREVDTVNEIVTVTKQSITNIVIVESNGKITDLVKQDGRDLLVDEEDVADYAVS